MTNKEIIVWEAEKAKDALRKALEATPEYKIYEKAEKDHAEAYMAKKEAWNAEREAFKAYAKARRAMEAIPEYKVWDEAWNAWNKAKYAEDEA